MRICLALALTGCALQTSTDQQPIIGGTVTSTTTYKTVVDLEEEPGNWFCTGTLIDKDWVLTAAHCMEDETVAKVHIRFDDDDINDTTGGIVVDVAEIHADPTFNENDWDNDIALIRLATSVTDRAPTPVHRPAIAIGSTVTEVGFGDADDNGNGAGILRKLDTPTVDCAMANDPTVLNANLLCFNAHDGNTSCYGDSGGPAFFNGEVAGITSGGTGEMCSQGWDLYTSVAAEIDYVDMIMGANTGSGSGSDVGPGSDAGSGSDGSGDETGGDHHDSGGCSTSGDSSLAAFLVGAVFLIRRRRSMFAR